MEKIVKIGDSILLEPKNAMQPEKYRSMVVELNEDSVFIDYPVNTSTKRTVFLLEGTQLKLTYITADGTVFLFDTEVLGRVKASIPMVKLLKPAKSTHVKIQRREYVRIETKVDVAVHGNNGEFEPFASFTEDISAGGAAVLSPKGFIPNPGTLLKIWLALPFKSGEFSYLSLQAEVIRLIEKEKRLSNLLTLQFKDITASERQALIRFCFEKQLEHRNKGL